MPKRKYSYKNLVKILQKGFEAALNNEGKNFNIIIYRTFGNLGSFALSRIVCLGLIGK